MKNQWYRASDKETLGGYKCIKNSISKELCLVSKKGEIWEYSETHYACLILSTSVANKYGKPKEKVKKGEEFIVKFPKEQLDKWVKILGIKNNRKAMIDRANNFGIEKNNA